MAPKTGVDDFLAAGGTVEDLIKLSRRFDKADFATVRMSRNDQLRAGVEDLRRKWRGHEWRTQGDYTARSIMRVLIRAAEQRGKPVEGGIRVSMARRTLALEAAVSSRAPTRAIPKLEALGFLRRDNQGRKRDKPGAFVLLTGGAQRCPHNGKGTPAQGTEREVSFSLGPYDRGGDTSARPIDNGVPELRWPTIIAYRERDKRGRWERKHECLSRLGKKRQAVLEYLVDVGGVATVSDLMERFASERTRPRDFRRRILGPLTSKDRTVLLRFGARRGENLERIEEEHVEERTVSAGPAIIVVEGDVVSLAGKWWEALEHARGIAGEIDRKINGKVVKGANTLQADKYDRESRTFRVKVLASQGVAVEDIARRVGLTVEQVISIATQADPEPEMRPIPDLRKPWPVHPTGCACPHCVERFGPVEGEHVEGCNCARCFTARKEAAGGARRAPSGVVPLPRQHRTSKPRAPVREASAAVVEIHKPAEPPEPEHPWHCGCPECGPEPKYVRLKGMA